MYICILYAAEQRNKCGWSCITITLIDHPFYANATEIVLAGGGPCSHLSGVVNRLGGFYILLSSMGYTGTIVAGNGTDAFSIYTPIHHLNETTGVEQWCSHDEWKCMCQRHSRIFAIRESIGKITTGVVHCR